MATVIESTRKKLKMSQSAFWGRIGITQSGGSRYENGSRVMPAPVAMLFKPAYGNKRDREQTQKQLGLK